MGGPGRLISGQGTGKLLMWNVATGELYQVLEGHKDAVLELAVCGSRLARGCGNWFILVWGAGAGGGQMVELSLLAWTYRLGVVVSWMAGQGGELLF